MKILHYIKSFALVASLILWGATTAFADLEWSVGDAITLEAEARDVAESPDGSRLFVLTVDGKIVVMDSKGEVETTIPGPFEADRLHVSQDGKKLYLGGKGQKALQVVSLEDRFDIDIAGSPVKGDLSAAVSVVVFSDFQ